MDSKPPKNSDVVDSVRNMAISRLGSVRTRGGKFPPISKREMSQITGNRKIIAPNIPQRRRIKQEIETPTETIIKTEPKEDSNSTQRDSGRNRKKVLIQTEGTFLADGPAFKTKREPPSYERFSFARVSRTSADNEVCGTEFNEEAVKDLLETPYLGNEVFKDFSRGKSPYCLGIPQKKKPPKEKELDKDVGIKKKISDGIKKEKGDDGIKKEKYDVAIKKEKYDDVMIKKEKDDGVVIKKEKGDDVVIKKEKYDGVVIKKEKDDDGTMKTIKIKREINSDNEEDEIKYSEKKLSPKQEIDSKTEGISSAEQFQNLKDSDEMMILLQIPTYSSVPGIEATEGSSNDKNKEYETETGKVSTFTDSLEEGLIGKLQIMKSGRMKIVLGSAEFDLIDGSSLESYWEAVSIRMLDEGGDIAVLGKIEKKMILTPVMGMLLKKKKDIKQDMD